MIFAEECPVACIVEFFLIDRPCRFVHKSEFITHEIYVRYFLTSK